MMSSEHRAVREHERTPPVSSDEDTNGRGGEPDEPSRAVARTDRSESAEDGRDAEDRSSRPDDANEPIVLPAPRASAGDPDVTLDVGHLQLDELTLELETELGIQRLKLGAKSLDAELHLTADLDDVVALVGSAARSAPGGVKTRAPGVGSTHTDEGADREERHRRSGAAPDLSALKKPAAAALAGIAGTAAARALRNGGGRTLPFGHRKSVLVRLSTPMGKTVSRAAGKVAEAPEEAVRALRRTVG